MWNINTKASVPDTFLSLEDTDGWYKADIRSNGCLEFTRLHNVPLPITNAHPQLVDRIHFCDLNDEIKRLEAMRDQAKKFFGPEWPF